MYKIYDKIIKFIKEHRKKWRKELDERKNVPEVKILTSIFQEVVFSPLQFVITIMPLNQIFKKCKGRYKVKKCQQPNIHMRHQIVCKQ